MAELGRVGRLLVALWGIALPCLHGGTTTADNPSAGDGSSAGSADANPAGQYCYPVLADLLMLFGVGSLGEDGCVALFPGAQTTGADSNVVRGFTPEVTADGAVLENLALHQQVTISADHVVLRNVRITTPTFYGLMIDGRNVLLEDVTVVGTPGNTSVCVAANGPGFAARRVDVSGCEDGVRLGADSELRDSYVHDLAGTPSSHYDAVSAEGAAGWVIEHNTIINDHGQTAAITFGLGAKDGLITNNYVSGGGYTLYAGPGSGTGVRVLDNHFSAARFPKGGYWGPVAYWSQEGNLWAGNTWLDGRREGGEVLP